jgi:3-dehydroquinate dehydratase
MYKQSFLHQNKPLLTCMIQTNSVEDAINTARNALFDGADAFGFQMCRLDPAQRTQENLRAIFRNMGDKPIYVTNYRYGFNEGKSDDELFEGMRFLLQNGATCIDIMGDMYCEDPLQLTMDPTAIAKQKRAIEQLHEEGAEVLMSTHTFRFAHTDEILRMAFEHKSRGADICKIVAAANNEDEELENLKTTMVLKKELGIPFLFLSTGTHNKFHRQIGPMMGCCMCLAVDHYDPLSTKSQPQLRAMRAVLDHFDYSPERTF